MPNFKTHATTGAAIAGVVNLVWQWQRMNSSGNPPKDIGDFLSRIELIELGSVAVMGAAVGSIPDWLEPASNPNHRALFHSLLTAGGVAYAGFGKHTNQLNPDARALVQSLCMAYLSHLSLDATTPKGLPLIC